MSAAAIATANSTAAHSSVPANSVQALRQRVKQLLSPSTVSSSLSPSAAAAAAVSPSVAACTPVEHPLRWWLRGTGYRSSGVDGPITGGHNLLQPGWQWVNEHGIVLTRDVAAGALEQVNTIDACVEWSTTEASAASNALPDLVRALQSHSKDETTGNGFAAIQPCSASWDHLKNLLHEELDSKSPSSASSSSSSSTRVALVAELPPTASDLSCAVQNWSELQLQNFLQAHEQLAVVAKKFADEEVASVLPLEWADAAGRPAMGQLPMPNRQWYATQTSKEGVDAEGEQSQSERADEALTAGERVNRALRGATEPIFFLLPWNSSHDRRPPLSEHTPARAAQPTSSAEEMAWAEVDEAQRDASLQACIEPAVLAEHGSNLVKSAPFYTVAADSDSNSPLEAEARLDQPSAWMAQLSSVVRGCPWPLVSTSSTMSSYASRIWSETVCAANHIAAQLRLLDLDPVDANVSREPSSLVPPDISIACVDLHLFWTACATSSSPVESAETRNQMETVRLAQAREADARGNQKPAAEMSGAWSHRFASRRYLSDSAAADSGVPNLARTPLSKDVTRVLQEAFPFPIEIHLGRHYSPAPVVIASPIAPGWVACILVGSDATLTQRF